MAKSELRVFADSNFFIGLYNSQDSMHENSKRVSRQIGKIKPQVFISNLVFLEIVTVLSQRCGRERAVRIGNRLIKEGKIGILFVNENLTMRAWEIFKQIPKKNMSFVDCSSLVVMDVEGINKFLTFDEEDFSSLRRKYKFSFF